MDLSFDLESRDAENAVSSDATMKGLVDLGNVRKSEYLLFKERSTSWREVVYATIHKLRANKPLCFRLR